MQTEAIQRPPPYFSEATVTKTYKSSGFTVHLCQPNS